jgi:asparagine synthase (glutamine-hydrolyzing)
MVHRGPDDCGVELFDQGGYHIGLAHQRLSILDLSFLGHQPMFSADGQLIIVFNGEIYNFNDLKAELLSLGYVFRTTCDTEVILSAYDNWGFDCAEHLNGMFAFVIYDKRRELAYCARDRFGKKPFYYYHTGQEFVFASELKALMKFPYFNKIINFSILGRFLMHGYINAPDSIFEQTFKLEPGHYLVVQNGKISLSCYWNPVKRYNELAMKPVTSLEQAKSELSSLIDCAVQRRMIADVPIGTFLSGGIDSTIVTAYAQKNSPEPVKTYSIGFADKEYDEAVFSKEIAHYLGTDHHETYIDEVMMLDLVESIPQYFDEPFGDSSQIPTMLVSKAARKDIVVALSGDGGDELFCGYNTYDKVLIGQKLDIAGTLVHPLVQMLGLSQKLPAKVRCIINNREQSLKTQMPHDSAAKRITSLLKEPYTNIYYPIEEQFPLKNWQMRRMLLDILTYLPGDILTKVDRASMKYSLETRCPLLDYEVAEYSFRLPHSFKYRNGDKKFILKQLAYELVPRELLDRPKKGFAVPIMRWLRGPLKEKFAYFSSQQFIEEQGIFDYDGVCKMKNNIASGSSTGNADPYFVWHFLMFQMWHYTHM